MTHGAVLILMGVLFLGFGYMGVPVSFALMAGVFVATAFTLVSLQSMVGQLFHGIDSETLLAVPFFLLVGELMASSDVVAPDDPAVADAGRAPPRRPRRRW